jgi:hypothetical protein
MRFAPASNPRDAKPIRRYLTTELSAGELTLTGELPRATKAVVQSPKNWEA